MRLEFGYLPMEITAQGPNWAIETMAGLEATKAAISEYPNTKDRWFYPRLTGEVPSQPAFSRIFGMPNTHAIEHRSDDAELLKFFVWVLSFFLGIRLTSERSGFVDAASTETRMLVDFSFHGSVDQVISLADAFCLTNINARSQRKRFAAAVHALFMSQSPQLLQFERFIYLYSALDCCFAILWNSQKYTGNRPNHGVRTAWMCNLSGVPVPVWASVTTGGSCEISTLRNEAIHEALFSGEPFGFALIENSFERNLPLEMKNLTCRLLASIIGVPDLVYIGMPTDIYGLHRLHL